MLKVAAVVAGAVGVVGVVVVVVVVVSLLSQQSLVFLPNVMRFFVDTNTRYFPCQEIRGKPEVIAFPDLTGFPLSFSG